MENTTASFSNGDPVKDEDGKVWIFINSDGDYGFVQSEDGSESTYIMKSQMEKVSPSDDDNSAAVEKEMNSRQCVQCGCLHSIDSDDDDCRACGGALVMVHDPLKTVKKDLAGKTIALTGDFFGHDRREVRDMLIARGAKVKGAVTEEVDFLAVGYWPGSKLLKAISIGVPTVGMMFIEKLMCNKEEVVKCAEYVKSKGIGSLKEFSEICGISVRTLQNWYVENKTAFNCMLLGAVEALIDELAQKQSREVFQRLNPFLVNAGDEELNLLFLSAKCEIEKRHTLRIAVDVSKMGNSDE